MTSGPKQKPMTKTDTTKEASSGLVEWNCFITSSMPGANTDDAKGLIQVSDM